MPYGSVASLPDNIKKLPATKARMWMHVWNSAYAAAKKAGKSDKDAEQAAFERANGVLKKRMGWRDTMPTLSKLFGKKTKTEDGVQFPAAAYAYVGDPNSPSTWKVRLWESPDKKETAKQVGMAVAAVGAGFRGNKADIPAAAMAGVKRKVRAAWKRVNPGKSSDDMPDAIKMSVNFSVTDAETGAVYHWGKIFEPGTYADKGFSLTVDEMDAAIEAFQPVHLKAGHPLNRSQLDGKMGDLIEVEKGEDNCLYGLVEFPGWLDKVLGDAERTVSTEWSPMDKRLVGLSLVTNPRVEDATLFAAFAEAEGEQGDADDLPEPPTSLAALQTAIEQANAPVVLAALVAEDEETERVALIEFAKRHDTREGQRTIQSLHDTCGSYGAVCKAPSANMASQHEADVMQQIHDLCVEHGATCSDIHSQPSWMYGAPEVAAAEPPKEESMTFWEKFRAQFGLPADWTPPAEEPPATEPATPPTTMGANATPTPDPEKARLQEENARLQAQVINTEAKAYSDSLLAAGKILPNEQEHVIRAFSQARINDIRMGPITFADGKQGSNVDIVRGQYDVRPTKQYDLERLPANVQNALVALSAETKTPSPSDPPSAERLRHLMSLTAQGQAHMKAMSNGTSRN